MFFSCNLRATSRLTNSLHLQTPSINEFFKTSPEFDVDSDDDDEDDNDDEDEELDVGSRIEARADANRN